MLARMSTGPVADHLQAFLEVLRRDRAEPKRKEAATLWTRWVSLWIAVLAVFTALGSQQHGKFVSATIRELNQAAISQGIATNLWAWYQSTSVKLHVYEFERWRASQTASDGTPA